tara:strand:+ start:1470 stop:1709 length:240 start_codon:yes stop_codon:yes gene_type:complete
MTKLTPFTAEERSKQKRKLRSAFFKLEQHIYSGVSINTEIKLGTVEKMYYAKLTALNEAIEAICTPYKEYLKTGENNEI